MQGGLAGAPMAMEDDQLASMSTEDVVRASCLLDNVIHVLMVSLVLPNLDLWFRPLPAR